MPGTDRLRTLALTALALLLPSSSATAQCIDYAEGIRYVGVIGNAPQTAYTDDVASDESIGVIYRAVHGNHIEYGNYAITYVYDVSVPGTLTVLATVPDCSIPDGCWSFSEISAGDGILAGLEDDSLYVGDAADPLNISLVSMPMADAAVTAVGGGNIYVLGTDFVVVDVSTPGAPVEVGRNGLGISGDAMVAVGNVVYVAGGAPGLHVVDASDETDPQLSSTLALPHDATHIDRRGTFLYVASDTDVTVVEVTSPSPR